MQLPVEKRTGTYSDTLKAVGLADLLMELTGKDVRIRDVGSVFQIEGADLDPAESWPTITPGYPYILDSKDAKRPEGWVLDYDREKEKAQFLKEFRQANKNKRERIEAALREQGLEMPPKPVREYQMASFLASMRKGWQGDKYIFCWISDNQDGLKENISRFLNGYMPTDGFPRVTNSQIFNPIAGKGVHRPKPDSIDPGSINNMLVNGFDEWLKIRGAFKAMLPFRSGDDFRVFVIEPKDISVDMIHKLRNELLDLSLFGGIRLDIDATLRLLEKLILHSDAMGQEICLFARFPSEVIGGLHQAYFQSLGTAAALMNYAFMPLPSWFAITNKDDANAYLEIIKEHAGDRNLDGKAGCLRVLREDNSGDIPIMQAYREWLLTGSLDKLLDFFSKFAVKVMERRSSGEWVNEFSEKGLDVLLGRGYEFVQDIISNQGFRNIARAIRNATVYALSLRNREVHFGLAQEWKQKIKGGSEEFIAAIADFIQQYNWESEKIKAHVVKDEDIDAVVELVTKYGAELVGMLLLAYGYARAPKVEQEVNKEVVNVEA